MAFSDSKYQAQIQNARQAIQQFGKSGIVLTKTAKNARGSLPNFANPLTNPRQTSNTIYLFTGLVFPLENKENLTELVGKQSALLSLESNSSVRPEGGFIEIGDTFIFSKKTYKIIEVNVLDPDGEFPILFECVVE